MEKTNVLKKSKLGIEPLIVVIFAVVLALIPLFKNDNYTLQIFILIFLYAACSGSWNIIGGYAGQISLGHVAFFGIGAYSVVLLYINTGLSPWAGMIVGGIIAAVVGGAIGYPCFKLRGPFFTLATLAFGEVMRLLSIWARDFTGGSVGKTIPIDRSFIHMQWVGKTAYYYIILAIMIIILIISIYIQNNKFGYYLTAIKEDHDAAEALGVHTAKMKLYAMAISAFLTAICGAFYAQLMMYIEPAIVFINTLSNQFALFAVVGGQGTAWGPVIGSFIMTPVNEALRTVFGARLSGMNYVIYGIILILVVTFMPDGLFPFFKKLFKKQAKKNAAAKEVVEK